MKKGQITTQTDKNGVILYIGDKVKGNDSEIHEVVYCDGLERAMLEDGSNHMFTKMFETDDFEIEVIRKKKDRFLNGAMWETNILGNMVVKIVDKEWSKTEVRLTSGQIFTKIFLSKYYKHICNER